MRCACIKIPDNLKIVIITAGQPSANPRVVKEADALSAAGVEVTVLYFFWIQWAQDADAKLLKKVRWNYYLVGGLPDKSKRLFHYTRVKQRINSLLNKWLGNRWLFAERAQARCYDELLQKAKSIKADWYIAHNLGAVAVAKKAAVFNQAQAGFDFEDYHREENENVPLFIQRRILYLEQKYIPRMRYISASSPLVSKKVQQNFPTFTNPVVTVLNCFPVTYSPFTNRKQDEGHLKLFWFSQTVGKNRGLEVVIKAMEKLNNPSIHLTLVGRRDSAIEEFIDEHAGEIRKNIHFAGIVEPGKLPGFASTFDVGLATEIRTPLNRDICLTNKIFTYLVAGVAVLASNTTAQQEFLHAHKGIGLLYEHNDVNDLADKLQLLYSDRDRLQVYKQNAYSLGQTRMNWEVESKKLTDLLC